MCDCKCGSGGPVIIQCGGESNQPGTTTPPPSDITPGTPPTDMPKCAKLVVRVNSLRVNNAGPEFSLDNLFDPADFAGDHQWNLTIKVGDRSRTFRRDPVKDGDSFNLGFEFSVEIPNNATTFSVQATGFEDQNFTDPSLPSAEATHGAGDNFGIGSSHQIQGSDSEYDYTIDYTVRCATPNVKSVIRGENVVSFVREMMGGPENRQIMPERAVEFFISKMERSGLSLLQAQEDVLVFEGTQSVSRVVRQVFPKSRRPGKKAK